ncbi:prefoldin subunit 6 [Prorops nasuta]|uniref:prefoldin subunit 6 n=1 Tax=Prorops nasuta TaxID=863751 RepID=UPI0034CE086B
MVEEIQKNLQDEIDKFKQTEKDYQKALSKRQQLAGQLNENACVKVELDLLKVKDDVYKLIGPVLVKQDLEEAKQNVNKRMDYISAELNRVEDQIGTLDKKQENYRESLAKLQQLYQKTQAKASFNQVKL